MGTETGRCFGRQTLASVGDRSCNMKTLEDLHTVVYGRTRTSPRRRRSSPISVSATVSGSGRGEVSTTTSGGANGCPRFRGGRGSGLCFVESIKDRAGLPRRQTSIAIAGCRCLGSLFGRTCRLWTVLSGGRRRSSIRRRCHRHGL